MHNAIETLGVRLADNYTTLRAAMQGAFEAVEEANSARLDLKEAQARILRDYADNPKELGGNEAARQARIDELTGDHRYNLAHAEDAERQARHQLDLARLDLEASRAQLRIAELLAGSLAVAR